MYLQYNTRTKQKKEEIEIEKNERKIDIGDYKRNFDERRVDWENVISVKLM